MNIEANKKWRAIPEMTKEVYTPQMCFAQDARVIKYWSTLNVIPVKNVGPRKWTRFTISELIWINTISKMREFGIPLARIKTVFDTYVVQFPGQWETLIHHIIYEQPVNVDIIIGKNEIYLFINSVAHFWINNKLTPNPDIVQPDSHITINVNSIMEKILRTEELPLVSKIYINYLNRKLDYAVS